MFNNREIQLSNGIKIICQNNFLDIILLQDDKILSKIMLSKNNGFLVADQNADINFDDIIGVRGKGYGTIIMNSAISYLKENYNSNLLIAGIISDVADENLDTGSQIILKKKRRNFFKKFNFNIEIRKADFDKISSKIGDLKLSTSKQV